MKFSLEIIFRQINSFFFVSLKIVDEKTFDFDFVSNKYFFDFLFVFLENVLFFFFLFNDGHATKCFKYSNVFYDAIVIDASEC